MMAVRINYRRWRWLYDRRLICWLQLSRNTQPPIAVDPTYRSFRLLVATISAELLWAVKAGSCLPPDLRPRASPFQA
jgi:hypothetical protein